MCITSASTLSSLISSSFFRINILLTRC
jgi:hypothetical protein